jgi:DNA-binding CsgD family transcriptional regulator
MPKPLSPNRLGALQRKITDRFVQACGEQQIGYRVEVLTVMALWAAEVSLEERARNGPPQVAEPVTVSSPLPAPPPLPFGMTPVLLELLELISERLTDRQVAVRLSLPERTVKRRLRELYAALGCSGRFESIVTGYEAGLLGPDARSAREAARTAPVGAADAKATPGPQSASKAATGATEGFGGRR